MSEEFESALTDIVQRHSSQLDADDLRAAADRLDRVADKWEVLDDV